jgi:hypothetical protein
MGSAGGSNVPYDIYIYYNTRRIRKETLIAKRI